MRKQLLRLQMLRFLSLVSLALAVCFFTAQRAAADEKLADLLAKKKGSHFLQIVKDPMPEPEAAETPAV